MPNLLLPRSHNAFQPVVSSHPADAARSLPKRRLARRVDPERMGEPRALGVIVSSGYGYTREDGVQVIPIGALGP